ncbi:MAG: ABC transporter ATP-binding protein [Polyangiales bacterium]
MSTAIATIAPLSPENTDFADIPGLGRVPTSLQGQLRRHLPTFIKGAVYLLAVNLIRSAIDLITRYGVNALTSHAFDKVARAGAAIILLTLVAVGIRIRSRVIVFNGGRDIEFELRGALLTKLHTLGASFFRRMPVGEVMSRTTNDLAQVRLLFGFGALNVVNTLFAYVTSVAVMIGLSLRLTIASTVVYPLLILLTRGFSKRIFVRTRANQDALGAMSDRVQANLAGVRVVRSFALEDSEQVAFEKVNDQYLHASLAIARLRGMMGPIAGMLATISTMVVFWYGGRLVVRGDVGAGDFVVFLSVLSRLAWPTMALGFMLSIVQRGRASFSRLSEIFHAEPDVVSGGLPAPASIAGALEVRGLTYDHGTARVLDDVSFKVEAGKSLAIVGRTGAGKTTLASLLPRLLPTPRGSVFLDGVDVCDLPLETVRRAIGYAQQDAFLFSTTVQRNVGFAIDDPESPESLLKEERALEEAQLLDEVRRFTDGMQTIVGERGVQLSGGQRQRVALARALLREPPILVLDDPLSAVDAKTEAAILEALERQRRSRTVILVTHRVAAASRCDHIVVLDAGKVIEAGTHEELIANKDGLYARFADEQARAHELEDLEVAQ